MKIARAPLGKRANGRVAGSVAVNAAGAAGAAPDGASRRLTSCLTQPAL
ncbi:MAG: hypothetical protein LBR07_04880 [Puniceicoccales bacterium]|nr:hypothetical protein [Puniceicoccales bacterium]